MKRKVYIIIALCAIVVGILSGCVRHGTKIEEPEPFQLIQEDIYTLSDGETVDLYHSKWTGDDAYAITDGSLILRADNSLYIKKTDVLSEIQMAFVEEYYENQELPYDIHTELEKAYMLYQARKAVDIKYENIVQNEESVYDVVGPRIDLSKGLSGYNDTILCTVQYFFTPLAVENLRNPVSRTTEVKSHYSYTVFHAQTGEVMSQYDLFTIPAEDVPKQLMAYSCYAGDEELCREMIMNLKPEYIEFGAEGLGISFPDGIVGDGMSYLESIEYSRIDHILHPWAIPYNA